MRAATSAEIPGSTTVKQDFSVGLIDCLGFARAVGILRELSERRVVALRRLMKN